MTGRDPIAPVAREVPALLWRKAVWPPAALGIFLFLLGWAVYLSYTLFHYDILSKDHAVDDDRGGFQKGAVYLYMALTLTVLGIGGGWWIARAHLFIVRHGQKLTGRFVARGAGSYKGMTKAVAEYELDGKRYEHAATVSPELIKGLIPGDPIVIYVHSKRPNRAVVLWSPASEEK